MNLQITEPSYPKSLNESMITLRGITWDRFKTIESDFADINSVRLTYVGGDLEIMAPIGEEHEAVKSTLGFLLETYMWEKDIRFYKRGGFTLEKPGYAAGEPDESYSIGSKKAVPDIVIEIIVTSGSIKKLDLYKPLEIPEVWFWKANRLNIFRLKDGEYQEISRSEFFPDLDVTLLLDYLQYSDQYDAVREFRAKIHDSHKP
jgi:Uma2 family endonuclease